MTRLMFDAITPSLIPAPSPEMVAGYVGGQWPSYQEMVRRFPNSVHVSIAVQADQDAQVLDVENLDATPAESVDWVLRQRANGNPTPTVYCNQATWQACKNAFLARGIPYPLWWIANYDGVIQIPIGAIAKQYQNTPGYDLSVVADYWPGVDSPPVAHPIPTHLKDKTMMMLMQRGQRGEGALLLSPTSGVLVPDPGDWAALKASGVPAVVLTSALFDKINAEVGGMK